MAFKKRYSVSAFAWQYKAKFAYYFPNYPRTSDLTRSQWSLPTSDKIRSLRTFTGSKRSSLFNYPRASDLTRRQWSLPTPYKIGNLRTFSGRVCKLRSIWRSERSNRITFQERGIVERQSLIFFTQVTMFCYQETLHNKAYLVCVFLWALGHWGIPVHGWPGYGHEYEYK